MVEIMGSLFRSEKGEEIAMFGSRSSTNVNTSNVGANTQYYCFPVEKKDMYLMLVLKGEWT